MTPKVNIPLNKPVTSSDNIIDEEACPICGATDNLLVNGYCIDCDEELTAQIK
jgi:hypothetical protein